jgi:uracil-DNA glycosylase
VAPVPKIGVFAYQQYSASTTFPIVETILCFQAACPAQSHGFPEHPTLAILQDAVQSCQACDLYLYATQAVFGEGRRKARLFLIGEQPGNEEDLQGHPFVGPAGRILDRALADSSIERAEVYVTNAVKHFKFEERGKRRLHKKPMAGEIRACRPWLEAEVKLIAPKVIVCLGATASQTVLGNAFRLTRQRGVPLEHPWASQVVATIHPSAILRVPDQADRHAEYSRFVDDLKSAAKLL